MNSKYKFMEWIANRQNIYLASIYAKYMLKMLLDWPTFYSWLLIPSKATFEDMPFKFDLCYLDGNYKIFFLKRDSCQSLCQLDVKVVCIILDYKNFQFKQLIDGIAIDLSSSGNFASMVDIRRKYNPMIDLSKFTFNKKILSKVVTLNYNKFYSQILSLI